MSFLSPMTLIALFAALVPLVIHLLRRRTAGRVPWGAWMFLYESMRKKRRKLMLEDILLLVIRSLIVITAVLAFSRPFLKEIRLFGIAGSDKDVVIVIDTSASMRLGGSNGRTSFERAVDEARELVRLSPEGTAFGIVCGESTPAILTSAPLSDKREIICISSLNGCISISQAYVQGQRSPSCFEKRPSWEWSGRMQKYSRPPPSSVV